LHLHYVKEKDIAYHKAFGKHLVNVIRNNDLTPETVAARGEIETKAVYRVINAEHSPTLATLRAIAKGLNMSISKLLDFKHED